MVANHGVRFGLSALDGNMVYVRTARKGKPRVCMRRVGGKVRRATRVPSNSCGSGEMGLDSRGRAIYTFAVDRIKGGFLVSKRWYVYDLKSDRARPVKGLPRDKCVHTLVRLWRKRMVYGAGCASAKRRGLWVKEGKKTRRILADAGAVNQLTLRGGALVAVAYTGPRDASEGVVQLMVGGKPCVRVIETSIDDPYGSGPAGVWIANGYIVWRTGDWTALARDLELVASKLPSGCGAPGPTGRFGFTPETDTFRTLAVDGRQVYYAGNASIRRHTLPAQPSYAPPPNDNFENAQSVALDAPRYTPGWTARATTQPGEPLANSKQSVWYTFTPATSGTVYVRASGRTGEFGVYTGTGLGTLTPVAGPSPMYVSYIQFDAVAGQKYWIDVGTSNAEPDYKRFYVGVRTTRPPG